MNRIETEPIARKGQQLTGQSPTICACGKSIMHQLADHMSITFMPSKGQRQKALQFRELPSKKRHKPSRQKIRNTTNDQDM